MESTKPGRNIWPARGSASVTSGCRAHRSASGLQSLYVVSFWVTCLMWVAMSTHGSEGLFKWSLLVNKSAISVSVLPLWLSSTEGNLGRELKKSKNLLIEILYLWGWHEKPNDLILQPWAPEFTLPSTVLSFLEKGAPTSFTWKRTKQAYVSIRPKYADAKKLERHHFLGEECYQSLRWVVFGSHGRIYVDVWSHQWITLFSFYSIPS